MFLSESKSFSKSDFKKALKNGEFIFHYQPEFELKTGKVVAVEALMRWNKPEGLVPPNLFIPALEETGFICDMTDFLLHQTLADLQKIHAVGLPGVKMAVNLSALQFNDENLLPLIQKNLKESGLSPSLLECEITENQELELSKMKKHVFNQLSQLGIGISIDDFGTGYSSFDLLCNLDVQKLKLDNKFTQNLLDNPKRRTVFSSIIQMAKDLDIAVLAEGIETSEQRDFLVKKGCLYGQGFWFCKPLPLDGLLTFLQKK